MLEATLQRLIPFRFLSPEARRTFVELAQVERCSPGDWIVRQGDAADRRVFVILEGFVEVVDELRHAVVSHIEAGRYFGERAALFEMPRAMGIRAGVAGVTLAAFSQDDFLAMLEREPALAHALGSILRERQGLFRAFDAFMAELYHGVTHEVVNFRALRRLYAALEPALHPHVREVLVHDFEALGYALKRLPEGISEAFMLYLTDTLHDHLVTPSARLPLVETAARRRAVMEMMPGKLMVLLRDGDSDLIDLVTCLCAYAHEASKLRRRLQREGRLDVLLGEARGGGDGAVDEVLASLGFMPHEATSLKALFGEGEVVARLAQIAMHHEDYHIQITKQLQGYNSQHAERWTAQIADAVVALMGCAPSELGCDVHIISSNTHSVQNCLSPYLRQHRAQIEAWGRAHRPELFEVSWVDESDRLYALSRSWFKAHPDEVERRHEIERAAGMLTLEQTALTGVSVELVDTSKLDVGAMDEALFELPVGGLETSLIVNIDYAFGQQAEEIMALLLMLFGDRVKSVHVMGKAGALQGRRGDLLVATAFVEQTQDVFEPVMSLSAEEVARLARRAPDRQVHVGPLLTVAGTLLQNKVLLNFYRRIWRCVGLEMEGTFYLREILKAAQLGVIPRDVRVAFLYYVSDVPLAAGESLAGALHPAEGIPPLYAITREVLCEVLGHALHV